MTREEIQQKLVELNNQLLSAKGREKRMIKKSIRNYEQMLRQQSRFEIKDAKQEWKADLASQGIDPNKGITDSVTKGLDTVGKIFSKGQDLKQDALINQRQKNRQNSANSIFATLSESPIMVISIIGLAGLFIYQIFIKSGKS